MAFDYLTELTTQTQGFTLGHSADDPLTHGFSLLSPAGLLVPGDGEDPARLALKITDTVIEPVVTLLRDTRVDLPLVGKWVRLPTPDLSDPLGENPIGGMPVAEQLQQLSGLVSGLTTSLSTNLPPATLMTSDAGQGAVPGVPALLGRLQGTITEQVRELREVVKALDPLGVTARVRIRVVDDAAPSSTVVTSRIQVRLPGAVGWQALSGLPAIGTALLDASRFAFSLRLPALFSELRGPVPELVRLSVHVGVDVDMQPPSLPGVGLPAPVRATIDLPPVPLVLPTIPVPTLVVLCEHANFLGRKLVVVPSDSLLGKAIAAGGTPIGAALSLTNGAIGTLRSVLGAASAAVAFGGFLDGAVLGAAGMASPAIAATMPAETAAAVLVGLAEAPGQTLIVASSQLTALDTPDLVFDPGGLFGIGRFTASDMASSVIVVGRPGTTVSFGQRGGFVFTQELSPLTITVGPNQLACAVSSLGPPPLGIGEGIAFDPNDPASFTTTVFGGAITAFSPRQNHDQIHSVAIARPPDGLSVAV
ncbi:MAG: hypothetical protein QOE31_3909 [Solirubrobacteraceae bacterium]|nr:hypothetical protein [Solirubrobacteraceae bacterium]